VIENWDQYKDLEYYPDRVCVCGCEGRIEVKVHHKYTGVPKYINGQKKIIELFGEPFHKPEEEQQRINLFAQHGYQTLITWYNELKEFDLIRRIIQFNEKGKLLCLQE